MASLLAPWRRSFGMLESFRQEMEDLIQRFAQEEGGNGSALRVWAPRIDVKETEKEIVVKADLPGVEAKDIEVSVVGGALTLRGEKKEEKEEKKENNHRSERFVGRFYRAISLPTGVDVDKVTATCSRGVITIAIPKKPESQPKTITIKAQD